MGENRNYGASSLMRWMSLLLPLGLCFGGAWLIGCGNSSTPTASRPPGSVHLAGESASDPIHPLAMTLGVAQDPFEAHAKLFDGTRFPSAAKCGQCHPTQFRQWSVSQHSYAQLSPIFNAMQGKTNRGNNGTQGDFCIRCHTQPGMILGESEFMSNIDRSPIAREGVTCIVCHRITEPMGKISGRLPLDEGEVTEPVYGPTGRNTELKKAIAAEDLITNPHEQGKKVHGELKKFFRITTSNFCGSCHDVTMFNGFRLEEAFSEYKHSPAAQKGVLCQDCHMGREPGRVLVSKQDPNFERVNYAFGPAAKVGDFLTAPRKLTNHMFVGPDYSVVPPWLFPHHPGAIKDEKDKSDARGLATIRQWQDSIRRPAGERRISNLGVSAGTSFPARWESADDRASPATDHRRQSRPVGRDVAEPPDSST